MDLTRYKRPGKQTPSHTTKTNFGNPHNPVPKVIPSRPLQPTAPIVRPRPAISHTRLSRDGINRVRTQQLSPIASPQRITPRRPVATPVVTPTPVVSSVASVARQVPIDMDLPGAESPTRLGAIFAHTRWQTVRQYAFRGMAVSLVLVLTLGGLLFSQSYLKLHKVFKGGTATAEALKANVNPDLLKGEGSGRVNILLMGRGGGTHDAPDLTDTMMLASIDPVNHTSTLVSVPRDLWVNVPNHGVMKLNAAWETGEFGYTGNSTPGSTNAKAIKAGFELVDQAVEDIMGVDVNYNVLVNFQAFQQAVDTVKGVSIIVPSDLVDPTMAWENGNNPVLAKAGTQVFDGTQALRYVRSRETTSDFARAERQRAMLVALKSKVVSAGTLSNPMKISGLINSFGNNIQTDLSLSNASRLYSITKSIPDAKTTSIGFADAANPLVTTGNINGQSVVLPKAGLFKYDAMQQFVRTQLKDPFITKEKAKVLVLNGTPQAGLATTKSNELLTYGYNVVGTGNTPNTGWTRTTLVDLTHKSKYTKHYLEQRVGVAASNKLSDNTIQTNGADFVIIIGSDEAIPTQTQTH